MFSDNGMISERQLRLMVVMPMFAAGVLMLPYLFARLYEEDILFGMAAFIIVAAVYLAILFFEGSGDRKRKINGSYKLSAVVDIIRNYIRLILYILLSLGVLLEGQVPFIEKRTGNSFGNMLILLPLILVALYGAFKGLENNARLYEMLMWSLIFPYLIMLIFGFKEMDFGIVTQHIFDSGGHSWGKLLFTSIGLLIVILPAENYLQLKYKVRHRGDAVGKINDISDEKQEHDIKHKKTGVAGKAYVSIIICILISCAVAVFVAGIYGVRGAAKESMVSIAIMRYIELPLGVLQRFDVLMVWFFMTGCFVLLSNTMFNIKRLLELLCSEKTVGILMVIIVIAATVISLELPEYGDAIFGFMVYGALIDIPLSLILPLVRRFDVRYIKRLMFIILLFFSAFLLSGCSKKIENIEQRDYATVLTVTLPAEVTPVFGYSNKREEKRYHFTLAIAREKRTGEKSEAENVVDIDADSFEELKKIYGNLKGKDLSLSHVKVLLVGYTDNQYDKDRLTIFPGDNFKELIYEMDETDEVARTCPLVLADDNNDIEEYMKSADKPVGTYLNDLVLTAKREQRDIPKLMDYLKAFREGRQIMVYGIKKQEEDLMLYCRGKL